MRAARKACLHARVLRRGCVDRTARTQVLRREYSVDRSAHAQAPPISNELARLSGRKDFIPLEEVHDLLNRKDVTSVQAEQLIRMVLQHRFINDNLYTSYIKACAWAGDLKRVTNAADLCKRAPNGLEGEMRLRALAVGDATEEVLREAGKLLSDPGRDKSAVYKEVIRHFVMSKGDSAGLEKILEKMKQTGVTMDIRAFELYLRPLILARDFRGVMRAFYRLREQELIVGSTGLDTLFYLFGQFGFAGILELYQREYCNKNIAPTRQVYEPMINFYHSRRDAPAVLRLFKEAQGNKIELPVTSFLHAFYACAAVAPEDLPKLRLYIARRTWMMDPYAYNSMLEAYSSKSMHKECLELFSDMQASPFRPNTTTYNILINSFGKERQMDAMVGLFRMMQEHGLSPDSHTYAHVIFWHSVARAVTGARELLEEALAKSIEISDSTFHSFVEACVDTGEEETCYKMVEEMAARGMEHTAYRALLSCYSKRGDVAKVASVSEEIRKRGMTISPAMYEVMLRELQFRGEVELCKEQAAVLEQSGVRLSAQAYGDLLKFYAIVDPSECERVLRMTREWKIELELSVYDDILRSFTKRKRLEECRRVFAYMRQTDILPNTASFNAVISAAASSGDMAFCESLLAEMRNSGPFPDVQTYNTLIDRYIHLKEDERVASLLANMKQDGIKQGPMILTTLLLHATRMDDVERTMELYVEMMKPSESIHHTVMFLLLRKNEYEKSMRVYSEMKQQGVEIKRNLYAAILRYLASRNDTEGLRRTTEDMLGAGIDQQNTEALLRQAVQEKEEWDHEHKALQRSRRGVDGNVLQQVDTNITKERKAQGESKDNLSARLRSKSSWTSRREESTQGKGKVEPAMRDDNNYNNNDNVVIVTEQKEKDKGKVETVAKEKGNVLLGSNKTEQRDDPEENDVISFLKLCIEYLGVTFKIGRKGITKWDSISTSHTFIYT